MGQESPLPDVTIDNLRWFGNPDKAYKLENEPATGQLADYRTELRIASDRVWNVHWLNKKSSPSILTHSFIDSVAYPTIRVFNMVNSGSVSEDELFRWEMVLNTNALILRDTLPAIPTIFMPGNDGDLFSAQIETALLSIITDWKIPHDTLTSPEEVATMISNLWKVDDYGSGLSDDQVAEDVTY